MSDVLQTSQRAGQVALGLLGRLSPAQMSTLFNALLRGADTGILDQWCAGGAGGVGGEPRAEHIKT